MPEEKENISSRNEQGKKEAEAPAPTSTSEESKLTPEETSNIAEETPALSEEIRTISKEEGKTSGRKRTFKKKKSAQINAFLFFIFNLSMITILVFALLAGTSYFTLWYFIRGEEVKIPNLIGLDVNTVLTRLQPIGLGAKLDNYEYSELIPNGCVLSQYPYPGTKAKRGSPVKIVLSKGSSLIKVPYIIGENYLSAEVKLRTAGLKVRHHSYIFSEEVGRDVVIGQDPLSQSGVPKDYPVNLLISMGSPPRKLAMPDLTKYTLQEAKEILTRIGFSVPNIERRKSGEKPAGMILEQVPKAGTPVTPQTSILLVISAGGG